MEISTVNSNGDVNIPKPIRDLLDIHEGTKLTFFEEDGKVVIAKDDKGMVAFQKFASEFSKTSKEQGITEEDLQNELERVRKEMYNAWNK